MKNCKVCGGEPNKIRVAGKWIINCCEKKVEESTKGLTTTCQITRARLRAEDKWDAS